jgi:hypothetical protein
MTEIREKGGADPRRPLDCAETRDLLPLRAAGTLGVVRGGQVEVHLRRCIECAEEWRFIERVLAVRPEPPADLAARVAAGLAAAEGQAEPAVVGSDAVVPRPAPRAAAFARLSRGWARGWGWGLAAAASVVLALGVGLLWHDGDAPTREALLSTLVETGEEWESEEWMVAGAPVWEALPDAVLMGLVLEEDT